ncbi:hypothetical protein [Desulfovibrio sp. ZJ200]|uniref:hypothetical protein n=1 Tax=Desulfovibrio sp. ZJ200 TaxID=2709792 RepID=UPI0013EB7404|nr:hypothetical protein [Desulfovibrio sp. ZJ200]
MCYGIREYEGRRGESVLIHFRSARRRIIGVLPMPDGTRESFKGRTMAQVLRQWQQALAGRDYARTRPRHC